MFLEALTEYGLFLAKAITLVFCIVLVVSTIAQAGLKLKELRKGNLELKSLNEYFEGLALDIKTAVTDEKTAKKLEKAYNKQQKEKAKQHSKDTDKEEHEERPKGFVLDFDGDITASDVESLRVEVSAILQAANAENKDKVILRLESPGGSVNGYGLAAAQLKRIRDAGLDLTVCVDSVAASGGYMMACQANHIMAAPFAVVGSIGVVAQLPNFHRFLKDKDIDVELFTAGEYKRTVTVFGENTKSGKKKFQEELDQTHDLFKSMVARCRPELNIDKVATGEIWYGQDAVDLQLIDEVQTSDEYLLQCTKSHDLFEVAYVINKPMSERFGMAMDTMINRFINRQSSRARKASLGG